jgi:5-formyltetrahydrofolate cyclo-ligase
MLKKIELRKKLKAISMVNIDFDIEVINKLNDIIKNKVVCTYVPLENEVDINQYLTTQALLTTTCVVNNETKVCVYEEPLEKNKFNVYQPTNLKIINDVDIFLVPGLGFDYKGTRLGKGSGVYDKLLSKFPESLYFGITDKQHLVNDIPSEIHDIQMHALVTHDELIVINI